MSARDSDQGRGARHRKSPAHAGVARGGDGPGGVWVGGDRLFMCRVCVFVCLSLSRGACGVLHVQLLLVFPHRGAFLFSDFSFLCLSLFASGVGASH